jgi:signal transduction histidine kinase
VRPLDVVGSIKLKLGIVILAAVASTAVMVNVGERIGLSSISAWLIATAAALAVVRFLAHGMTFPLRQMVSAAREMSRGNYTRRVTSTARDEVGELARAFNAMAEELQATDRVRRDLVANASHELRTPLSALRAQMENIVDGVESPDADTHEAMLRQVERLSALVDQLLDLSRLESGGLVLDRRSFAVGPFLEELVDEWRPSAQAKSLRLESTTMPAALAVTADEARTRQVLSNLLANAIRHSPERGAVRVRASESTGGVRLEVEDQGPGIAVEDVERVFERFYRADHARAATDGGSGLGLAISRWIVDLHGGTIRVENVQPTGCRMVVELAS